MEFGWGGWSFSGCPDGFEFKQLTEWLPQGRCEKTVLFCQAIPL
jgi:hypothetical protein